MVFLWWERGGRCTLAGSYKPRSCLAKIFHFFQIYFRGVERSFVLKGVGQDLNPAYENRESATYDAGEEHHLEDVGCEENNFVQYQIQGGNCNNCQE